MVHPRPGQLDLGLGGLGPGLAGLELGLAGQGLLGQGPQAIEIGVGLAGLGLGPPELGGGDAVVGLGLDQPLRELRVPQPHQRLAPLHAVAVDDQHVRHHGRDLGVDRHLVARLHDAAQALDQGQRAEPGLDGLHGRDPLLVSALVVGAAAAAGESREQGAGGEKNEGDGRERVDR